MKLIRSIKHQAVVMFVSYSLGLTLLYLALAIISAFVVEDELIDRMLQMEASQVVSTYNATGQVSKPGLSFVQVYEELSALPEFIRQGLEAGKAKNEVFTPTDDHFHVRVFDLAPGKQGYLVAEVSPLLIVTNTPQIFQLFVWGLIMAVIIGVTLAIRMASLTVKPVMAMRDAVLNKQPLPQLQYELGYLSSTLQQAFFELSRSLQREKDFTSDVSHELRTPLTVLSNTIVLAEQRGITDADLAELRQVCNQMQHTVEVLLALARAGALESQPCMLKPMIEQVGMQCAAAQDVDVALQIEVPDDFAVNANSGLLRLLLTNLINNAITHGSHHQLTICADARRLVFHNLSEAPIANDLTRPGVKGQGSKGIGQGLYLVTRILESLGWRYQLKQDNKQFSVEISL